MKLHFPNSYAEIDLHAMTDNLHEMKSRMSAGKILSVVKCNAYGHGAVRIAKQIEPEVDWFGVAFVDEAIELRMGGIKKPILVFGVPSARTAAAYQTHGLTATISDLTHFSVLMDGTKYHLNFNTGMNRLGFSPDQAEEVRKMAVANQRLICSGIYSHYSMADDPGSDEVKEQLNTFKEILEMFKEVRLVHICNTGGAVHYDLEEFDMIRTGLVHLGYAAGDIQPEWLTPVMTWKSKVVQIKKIKKGERVSYGGTWTATEDCFIGTVPVGYGDGVPRSLSNKLEVSVDGKQYRVVGNVTMDYIMINLGQKKLAVDSEVTIMGGDAWNAARWAKEAGTNVHEILTGLSDRMARSYTNY